MTNIKTIYKKMKTRCGQISGTDTFRHLGEVIEQNVSEKEAVKAHVHKIKGAYLLTKDTYTRNQYPLTPNIGITQQ